jgi:hypothetical protein
MIPGVKVLRPLKNYKNQNSETEKRETRRQRREKSLKGNKTEAQGRKQTVGAKIGGLRVRTGARVTEIPKQKDKVIREW